MDGGLQLARLLVVHLLLLFQLLGPSLVLFQSDDINNIYKLFLVDEPTIRGTIHYTPYINQ